MSTQELLTYLFNVIALGFTIIAAIDFGARLVAVYKQVSSTSNLPLTATPQPINQLPLVATPRELPQLSDPWLLPLPVKESVVLVKPLQKQQKHLRLLSSAKETSVTTAPKLEELLLGVDIDRLTLRQARKIAKVLEIAQKVNGRDQKLASLVSQIKLKLQQAKVEIVEVVQQELLAS